MNKLIKLPLFLAAVGTACGLALAGVNAATADKLAAREMEKIEQSYKDIFTSNGYDISSATKEYASSIQVSVKLEEAGCTGRMIYRGVGAAYTFEVDGYKPGIKFLVAFADGKYLGYTDLGNSETPGYGKDLIGTLDDLLKGKSSNNEVFTSYSGATKTGAPISTAIELARKDYNENMTYIDSLPTGNE